jgi:cellobiose phosphorylase
VKDRTLAEQLAAMGWDVLQRTAPYLTLTDPFALAGNPRFCTQYTNPATGEHVGPLLSGTAPWMWLSYLRMFGIHFHEGQVKMDPVLPAEWKRAGIRLNVPAGQYQIEIRKPEGAATYADKPVIQVDGKAVEQGILPAFNDSQVHNVEIIMQK